MVVVVVSLTETVLETVTDDDADVVVVVVRVMEEESSLLDDLTGFAFPKPGRYRHRALHLNPSSNVLLLLMLLFDSVLMKNEFRRESLLLVDPQDLLLFNDADEEDESCSLPLSARIKPERCLGEVVVEFGRLRLTNLVRTGCKGRGIGASKSLGGDIAGNSIISKLSFLLKDGERDNDLTDFGSIDISLSECLILVCLTRIFFFGSSLPRTCQSS